MSEINKIKKTCPLFYIIIVIYIICWRVIINNVETVGIPA